MKTPGSVLGRASHQELRREERLAAARGTADARRSAARQAAAADLIDSLDAGESLRKLLDDKRRAGILLGGPA